MIPLPAKAAEIIETLSKNGFRAYAVGGSVRYTIMGKPTRGWDFTTDATPDEILRIFPNSFYDNQFGTVGIKIYQSEQEEGVHQEPIDIYEVTTFRSEVGYTDRRHPDSITWGKTLEGDLGRRDFTINAIAYDGKTLFDPYNGMSDIDNKIVRAVGNPDERFSEDALRMMRAVRIASELGFTIDGDTFQGIKTHAKLITEISSERIRDELLKLMKSPYASDGILILKNTGILTFIMPEIDRAFSIPQKSPKRHHLYDVGVHSVMALKHCPSEDPIVRFATLIHDIGKPATYFQDDDGVITFYNHEIVGERIAKSLCMRLHFSKKDTDMIRSLVRWHQFSVDERQTDSAIRRFIRHVGKDHLSQILDLRIGDRLGGGASETSWRLELFKKRLEEVQMQPFSVRDLKIDGHDIMNILGCPPGPTVGKTLEIIFAEVDEGRLANDRDTLINKIEEMKSAVGD